jgi:hypothetical protein
MQRDYDKNPIVVKDRIPNIIFWLMMFIFILSITLILLFVQKKENVNLIYIISFYIVSIGSFFLFLYKQTTRNRIIIFYNNSIVRQDKDEVLEIKGKDVLEIKRTFIDFYDKRQRALNAYKPIYFLLTPISVFLQHPTLIIVKYFYKLFCNLSNKQIIDTIVIFAQNNDMISIFMATKDEKEDIKKYFIKKGIFIDKLPLFYTNQYSIDEVTYFINKKRRT